MARSRQAQQQGGCAAVLTLAQHCLPPATRLCLAHIALTFVRHRRQQLSYAPCVSPAQLE